MQKEGIRQNSFMFYLDQFDRLEYLTMEERGEMLTAIIRYAKTGKITEFEDRALRIIFDCFKKELDMDAEKYAKKAEANRVNGRKGGRPKGEGPAPAESKAEPAPTETKAKEATTSAPDKSKAEPASTEAKATSAVYNGYGLFRNVPFTEKELDQLRREFPEDWKNRVEKVSLWYHNKGLRCPNGLTEIRRWAKKDRAAPRAAPKASAYPAADFPAISEEEYRRLERMCADDRL